MPVRAPLPSINRRHQSKRIEAQPSLSALWSQPTPAAWFACSLMKLLAFFSSRLPLTAFSRFLTQFLPYAKFSAGIPSQTQTESQRQRQRQSRTKVKWKIFITDYIAIFLLRHRSFCFCCETGDWKLETWDLRQLHWDAFKKRIKSKWKRKHY